LDNDRSGPPDLSWLKRANGIRQELSQARYGKKGEAFLRAAKETRYAVSTLKREVAAAEFIERMDGEDPAFSADLKALGSNAVGEISRLFPDHPEMARAKARAAAAGSIPEAEIGRARLTAEANSPQRTGRGRSREFLRFLAEGGHRFGILNTRRASISGALMELQMRDREIGCALFDAGSASNTERVDRHLAMLLFYDRLLIGLDSERVPPVWSRRLGQMRWGRDRVLLFTRTSDGFQPVHHV